jgi:hypothetical protein
MADTIQVQIEKLTASIRALEAQRNLLGDEVVDTSLKALGAQLAALRNRQQHRQFPARNADW